MSILGSLLFLLHISVLQNCSESFDTIMSADDTNFFFEQNNLETLFSAIYKELSKVPQRFISNKLSLNNGEILFFLIHKPSQTENLSEILPTLKVNDNVTERVQSVKLNLSAF